MFYICFGYWKHILLEIFGLIMSELLCEKVWTKMKTKTHFQELTIRKRKIIVFKYTLKFVFDTCWLLSILLQSSKQILSYLFYSWWNGDLIITIMTTTHWSSTTRSCALPSWAKLCWGLLKCLIHLGIWNPRCSVGSERGKSTPYSFPMEPEQIARSGG
jgi:hypothetical protein